MKRLIFICCGFLLFTAMTCTKDTDSDHFHIGFYNESEYGVFVEWSLEHPDTTLSRMQNVSTPGWDLYVESGHSTRNALRNTDSFETEFECGLDTLCVFVFNADTLEFYGWDYVKEHYLIAQRYDLTLNDLYRLDWQLAFPPTPEMRDIKMWPPYGTYDSLGRRVER